MAPAVMLWVAGVTAMEEMVTGAAVTVRAVLPLTPVRVAVIVAEPVATALAMPDEFTVATDAAELVHVTAVLILAVELSL